MNNALLVPIHLDALVLENQETVLEAMADFARLPYYDGTSKQNVNADVPYISEEIVSHPFRDQSLRLGRGVHLHWALPDALTQGVNTANGVVFPSVPDRWLVTRSRRVDGQPEKWNVEKQWIVESDYLHPESDPEAKPPSSTVSFPLPPRPEDRKWQPFRYLGRKWVVGNGRPKNELGAEYLNALADEGTTDWHQVVGAGLTAIGYGEPAFAAFYPNCRSVFGMHDPDIKSFEQFKNVSYDVIGWYGQPEKRDCLGSATFEQARDAIAQRIRNEYLASGHPVVEPDPVAVWHEALGHHYGWVVSGNSGTEKKKAERIFCYASLTPDADANTEADPAVTSGPVDVAVGNTASEALSAYLAHQDSGDKAIIEEQLEALDLGHRLEHRQLDIGPKFREARHDKGFKSVRSGIIWSVRLERDTSWAAADPAGREVHAQTTGTLPAYLAHALNDLNMAQGAFQRAQEDMSSLRQQIYHDWTLYMRALRPPEGLESGYPDPVEIARFIEKTGLRVLKRKLAATGDLKKVEREKIGKKEGRDTPIVGASATPYTDPKALASHLANCINAVVDGLTTTSEVLDLLRRLDGVIAGARKSSSRGLESSGEVWEARHTLSGHKGEVLSASFDPDGKRIVTASDDGTARVWDAENGEERLTLSGHSDYVNSASFDPDGKRIVTASDDGTARVWDLESGEPPLTLSGHSDRVNSASFDSDGKRIVTASDDGTARVWDLESGEPPLTLSGHSDRVLSASFDPDGKRIVTTSFDGTTKVWDAENGEERLTLSGHSDYVNSASFDPDGKRIVTASDDGTARVWDAENGEERLTLSGHSDYVNSASFDPDGKRIVTASDDGTARVWDIESGEPPLTLSGHSDRVNSASFDSDGKRIVTANDDGTAKVWLASSLEATLKVFLNERGIPCHEQDSVQTLRNRIHRHTAELFDKNEHEAFHNDLADLLNNLSTGNGNQPKIAKMRYALRQVDAPRYYQPTDPVVLMAGNDLKPTERHGTDGKDADDGKLEGKIIPIENFDPVSKWKNNKVPEPLESIRAAILQEQPDGDQIGARRWRHQPWHPFLMEWQAEMFPVSEGSNREEHRQSYATGFVAQNYRLREAAVDLDLKPGAGAGPQTADTGIYSGSCVLTDHASDLLLAKLDRYLDKAEKSKDTKTETMEGTEQKLRAIREFLSDRPKTLSQALDGFHEALLQRHQILQLPIKDPIGFADMKPLTGAVREATQGRHSSSPLRGNDFTPIRSGTMKLRQLRLVDTFGRVKQVLATGEETPVITSEVLRSPDAPNDIDLSPRLLQPARINFRWLSAEHATGTEMDEPETNAHPAYTPVCGWILPNNLDNSLMVYDNKGEALGTIIAVDGRPAWQPAPGSELPRWEIEKAESARMNPHLCKLINTIVNELGKQDTVFFDEFNATLNNALETIAPEDFSHHESLALLMGRPIAVVRAMVNLELRGRPAANQSLSAFLPDMMRAVDSQADSVEGPERRAQFNLATSEKADFLQALDERSPDGIRPAFEKRNIALPQEDHTIVITVEAKEGQDGRWLIHLPARSYHVRQDADAVQIYLHTARTTDDFCHVRFPIRIGEDQQLNDGLVGYFVEEFDGEDYHYKDNLFHAPQAATPVSKEAIQAKNIQELADQLDLSAVPEEIADRLEQPWSATVTIDRIGHRWRIDTEGHVYNLVRSENGIELFELLDSSSEHIQVHWKDPINLMQSVDDAPQKLTMLVDPQGSVHAVSGILPTKSIAIPTDQYAEAFRKLEVTFLSTPILTEREKTRVPLPAEAGYQWSWLTRRGETWIESGKIDRIDTRASFSGQKIVEGWLKLKKEDNS